MTSSAITLYQPQTFNEIIKVGEVLSASGYFKDTHGSAQAVAKIMAGQELGITAMASLTGIYFFDGKITIGSNVMAQLVKRSEKYDYRIIELTAKRCEIVFFELTDGKREELGRSIYSMDDAKNAGLASKQNWQKYPQNMLFSRAISNGIKWFCPDVSMAGPIYTPDEMGADVDEDGNVIEGQVSESTVLDHLNHSVPLPPAEPEDGKRRLTKDELAEVHSYGKAMGVPTKEVLYHDILDVEHIEDFRSVDPKAEAYAAIELWYADQQKDDTGPDAAAEPQTLFDVPNEQPAEVAYD